MADIAKITLKGESEAKNFIDEALRGDIAYEELSTTVSKTGGYVTGDHLIYLGQYYEVVADIAQGGTIVTSGAGQNVEEREVGDEIKKNKTQIVAQMQTLENEISSLDSSKADKSDLASIRITGSTNNTGSTIAKGTFFYKSKVLVEALLNIADGATLTENTNYKIVTAGGLNELKNYLSDMVIVKRFSIRKTFNANQDTLIEFLSLIQSNKPDGYTFKYYTYAGAYPYTSWAFNISLVRNADSMSANDTRLRLVSSIAGSFDIAIYAYYYKNL